MNFAEKLEELDGVVKQLEEGRLSLDEALEVFEKGVLLVRSAREFLAKAEQRVTVLTSEGKEIPFEKASGDSVF